MDDLESPGIAERAKERSRDDSCSTSALVDDTTLAAATLTGGAPGLARRMLAQPGIEGNPLALLDATEAYWKASHRCCHCCFLVPVRCEW